jgi:hypothetical protein
VPLNAANLALLGQLVGFGRPRLVIKTQFAMK